jgi:Flp pilus assembly protein TadG
MRQSRPARRGVAATELAFLLPLLALLFAIGIDWSRIFYYSVTIDNCARNGAMYASDSYSFVTSPYADITAAALADAPNLSPQPTVTSSTGVYNGYSYVDCTVTYPFTTISQIPGIPTTTSLSRTVRFFTAPQLPK